MEHFLLYSLVLCFVSFLSIYLTRAPEEIIQPIDDQNLKDASGLVPAAAFSPGAYVYPPQMEEAEEELFSDVQRTFRFELPDLPRAVSDNQNPYF